MADFLAGIIMASIYRRGSMFWFFYREYFEGLGFTWQSLHPIQLLLFSYLIIIMIVIMLMIITTNQHEDQLEDKPQAAAQSWQRWQCSSSWRQTSSYLHSADSPLRNGESETHWLTSKAGHSWFSVKWKKSELLPIHTWLTLLLQRQCNNHQIKPLSKSFLSIISYFIFINTCNAFGGGSDMHTLQCIP